MELYNGASQATNEFTAIVLAGPGTRLFPLSEPENYTKALLPIGSKPMIWYTLQWLESEGIAEIIVATIKRDESEISNYIHSVYEGSQNIQVVALEDFYGTADVIRQLSQYITTDFIVTSTDAILDIPPHQFLDMYRIYKPDACCVLMQEMPSEGGGGCSHDDEVSRFYGVDQVSSKLVMIKDDNNEDDESISMRMSIINQFPSIFVSKSLVDMHVYVFQNWVLDFLLDRPDILSLGYDLMPLLVRMQSQKHLYNKEKIDSYIVNNVKIKREKMNSVFDLDSDNLNHKHSNSYGNGGIGSGSVNVLAYVRRGAVGGRANTVNRYFDLNKLVCRVFPYSNHSSVSTTTTSNQSTNANAGIGIGLSDSTSGSASAISNSSSQNFNSSPAVGSAAAQSNSSSSAANSSPAISTPDISPRSQITTDSIVGASTKISDRCIIKKSVIGSHVTIGKNVKLTNCIIHDYATIQDK
ncbi:putative translation initiation factor eIF-2B subunit gamma [Smittium culicis]|uniref:Translation initiation factor eIF2B subunit gamma n=1 Tax=Smittium culicis TaxID=133412 RepID=A0A1R1X5N1_9FUNG|nr:putative translation initiation factor eIF-2B subunit gamma [Smittium culicis]OMJ21608.1 putative translation initiation factor eIF-2B subunit gamma [Smittium culicis]